MTTNSHANWQESNEENQTAIERTIRTIINNDGDEQLLVPDVLRDYIIMLIHHVMDEDDINDWYTK